MCVERTVNEMCQIDEIVFLKTKMDLTSDFVSFQIAPLFQVLDN